MTGSQLPKYGSPMVVCLIVCGRARRLKAVGLIQNMFRAGWVVRVSHSENYCGPAVIAHLGWGGGGRSTYKHCGIHSAFTEDYYFSNSVLQLSPYNCSIETGCYNMLMRYGLRIHDGGCGMRDAGCGEGCGMRVEDAGLGLKIRNTDW